MNETNGEKTPIYSHPTDAAVLSRELESISETCGEVFSRWGFERVSDSFPEIVFRSEPGCSVSFEYHRPLYNSAWILKSIWVYWDPDRRLSLAVIANYFRVKRSLWFAAPMEIGQIDRAAGQLALFAADLFVSDRIFPDVEACELEQKEEALRRQEPAVYFASQLEHLRKKHERLFEHWGFELITGELPEIGFRSRSGCWLTFRYEQQRSRSWSIAGVFVYWEGTRDRQRTLKAIAQYFENVRGIAVPSTTSPKRYLLDALQLELFATELFTSRESLDAVVTGLDEYRSQLPTGWSQPTA